MRNCENKISDLALAKAKALHNEGAAVENKTEDKALGYFARIDTALSALLYSATGQPHLQDCFETMRFHSLWAGAFLARCGSGFNDDKRAAYWRRRGDLITALGQHDADRAERIANEQAGELLGLARAL